MIQYVVGGIITALMLLSSYVLLYQLLSFRALMIHQSRFVDKIFIGYATTYSGEVYAKGWKFRVNFVLNFAVLLIK